MTSRMLEMLFVFGQIDLVPRGNYKYDPEPDGFGTTPGGTRGMHLFNSFNGPEFTDVLSSRLGSRDFGETHSWSLISMGFYYLIALLRTSVFDVASTIGGK